jgi:hypothetical protein
VLRKTRIKRSDEEIGLESDFGIARLHAILNSQIESRVPTASSSKSQQESGELFKSIRKGGADVIFQWD